MTDPHEAPPGDAVRPTFLLTKAYRRFAECCDACRRHRSIGLCYGPPGVGTTLSARYSARWDGVEPCLHASWDLLLPPSTAWHTLLYTPPVTNTARTLAQDLQILQARWNGLVEQAQTGTQARRRVGVHDSGELMIVDEADRFKMPSLEQLRDRYDQRTFGVILIGMPGLEKR